MSTLDRGWVAEQEGGQWFVRVRDGDTPRASVHNVCGVAFTLTDHESVAKAIAQVPAMVAFLRAAGTPEAEAILAKL
jgi:hypothetical protein